MKHCRVENALSLQPAMMLTLTPLKATRTHQLLSATHVSLGKLQILLQLMNIY